MSWVLCGGLEYSGATSQMNILTLDFWLAIIVTILLTGIGNSLFKGPWDYCKRGVTKWYNTRNEKAKQEYYSRITKLKQSKDEQTFASLESLHILVFAVMQLLFSLLGALAVMLFLLIMPIEAQMRQGISLSNLLFIPAILLVFGISGLFEVIKSTTELYEARHFDDEVDVVLMKANGTRTEGIRCKVVSEDGIIICNAKLAIETGDLITIKPKLPRFVRKETYEVLDVDPSKMAGSQLLKVQKRKTLND